MSDLGRAVPGSCGNFREKLKKKKLEKVKNRDTVKKIEEFEISRKKIGILFIYFFLFFD